MFKHTTLLAGILMSMTGATAIAAPGSCHGEQDRLCHVVAEGGVGESGESSQIYHQVDGDEEGVIVVRTSNSTLCANTGAVSVLLINGQPVNTGMLAAEGGMQASAIPGDHVVVVVHTVPLFNDTQCVLFGELEYVVRQCRLE